VRGSLEDSLVELGSASLLIGNREKRRAYHALNLSMAHSLWGLASRAVPHTNQSIMEINE
jgi:hypothetical protein